MDWVRKQVGSLTQPEPCYSLDNQQLWLEYHRRDQARPWYVLRFLSVPLSRCDRVSLGACLRSVPGPCRGFNKKSNRGRNRLTRAQRRFVLAAIYSPHLHHPHLGLTSLTPSTKYQSFPSSRTTPTVQSDERLVLKRGPYLLRRPDGVLVSPGDPLALNMKDFGRRPYN